MPDNFAILFSSIFFLVSLSCIHYTSGIEYNEASISCTYRINPHAWLGRTDVNCVSWLQKHVGFSTSTPPQISETGKFSTIRASIIWTTTIAVLIVERTGLFYGTPATMKAAWRPSNCRMVRSRIGKCQGLAVHFEIRALSIVEKVSDLCTVLVAVTRAVTMVGKKCWPQKRK